MGLSRDLEGGFCLLFSKNDPKKHINKILAPTQSRDNPGHMFMFVCFSPRKRLLSAFSKRALHSNVPSNLVPSTFLKHFRGERGCPWYGPSAHPGRHFATRTLRYKRAFVAGSRYASLDLFLGILGARGTVPGWHLVRYLCETRKALHARHAWKTLIHQRVSNAALANAALAF